MDRNETIATINARLADADDETVEAVAEVVEQLTGTPRLRELSDREKALLEQSRADFAEGRTFTMEEFMARTDAMLARHREGKKAG